MAKERARSSAARRAALLGAVALALAPRAAADDLAPGADQRESAAPAALPQLPPPVAPIALRAATPEELARLDALLARLEALAPEQTGESAALVREVDESLLPALHERLASVAGAASLTRLRDTLLPLRARAKARPPRDASEAARAAEAPEPPTPDYLPMLLADTAPRTESWTALLRAVAMSRMLTALGTVQAGRELVELRRLFDEVLRADTQLQLRKLGPRALPALIEARGQTGGPLVRWASAELVRQGVTSPGKALATEHTVTLAEILRAYGRARLGEALPVLNGFLDDRRRLVREAAREAVVSYAHGGRFALRTAYTQATGAPAEPSWAWDRVAQELFAALDRDRTVEVDAALVSAREAERAGDLANERRRYDELLARSATPPDARRVAERYLAFARAADSPESALEAVTHALVALGGASEAERREALPALESLRAAYEAEALLGAGVADAALAERAVVLDPQSEPARAALAAVRGGLVSGPLPGWTLAAGLLAGLAAAALALFWRRPRAKR